eukprot:3774108-Pleurochrysis_carterae.AAC.2
MAQEKQRRKDRTRVRVCAQRCAFKCAWCVRVRTYRDVASRVRILRVPRPLSTNIRIYCCVYPVRTSARVCVRMRVSVLLCPCERLGSDAGASASVRAHA